MAVPFNLPTQAETEENYRRLNQLLVDLYDVLRQILMRRTPPPEDPHPTSCGGPPPPEMATEQALPLPDLVLDTFGASPPPPPPRQPGGVVAPETPVRPPRRRRPRRSPETDTKTVPVPEAAWTRHRREDWMRVGENLRKVADDFRASLEDKDKAPCPEPDPKGHWPLLSLLVPAPFNGSLLTAVIFLLSWRLFAAAR